MLRLKTLLKLRSPMLILMLLFLPGCLMGTKHVIQNPGQGGVMLSRDTAAMPDKDGKLEVGKVELKAGVLIRVPKTEQEVIDFLKANGAQFVDPKAK